MKTSIALLRGINVGGRNKIPMAGLRALCEELGWSDVRTYIQSGNVVFEAGARHRDLEADLESALSERFGVTVPVIVRSASQWKAFLRRNPFPDASVAEPDRVMIALSKAKPPKGVVEALRERASARERVVRAGDALWVHFSDGAARSKLTTPVFDRCAGSPVTARNWRTVLAVAALL